MTGIREDLRVFFTQNIDYSTSVRRYSLCVTVGLHTTGVPRVLDEPFYVICVLISRTLFYPFWLFIKRFTVSLYLLPFSSELLTYKQLKHDRRLSTEPLYRRRSKYPK